MICSGGLTIGAVFAFASYSSYVTGPVSALINIKMYFARIMSSARRLFKFMDMGSEADDGTGGTQNRPPRLEFQDVEFRYEENRPLVHPYCLVNSSVARPALVAVSAKIL